MNEVQKMNDMTTFDGTGKTDDGKEAANFGKETSSTDKSENEKIIKAPNYPFSVR